MDGNIIPTSGSMLGTSSYPWTALYIGSEVSYGDPYLPIYWLDGLPTHINGII